MKTKIISIALEVVDTCSTVVASVLDVVGTCSTVVVS